MADLYTYALCTVQDVKETLGLDAGNTSKDNIIKRKINLATDIIEGYCNLANGHHLKSTTYTNEEYDGIGGNQLVLRSRPISSITSFQYRNSSENEDSWSDSESNLYFTDLNSGVIDLLYDQNRDFNSYRVTYTAGYDPVPYALSEACATIAAYLVSNSTTGTGVKRKRQGQQEVEYFQPNSGSQSSSIVEQLGLDDILSRYIYYPVAYVV